MQAINNFKYIIAENSYIGNEFIDLCSIKDVLTLKQVCKWTHAIIESDAFYKSLKTLKRSVEEMNIVFYNVQFFVNTSLFIRLVTWHPIADAIFLNSTNDKKKLIRNTYYEFINHKKFDPKVVEEFNKKALLEVGKMKDLNTLLETIIWDLAGVSKGMQLVCAIVAIIGVMIVWSGSQKGFLTNDLTVWMTYN